MKAGVKKATIVIAVILCVILLAVLVLGFIRIRPLSRIGNYSSVNVLTSYNDAPQAMTDEKQEVLDKALKSVKFSVLRSIYEFNAKYNIKPVTEKDEDDNNVNVYLTAAEFSNLTPVDGEFMLKFNFEGEYQTNKRFVTLDGELIRYDSVIIIIPKSDKKIQKVRLYPYIDDNIGNTSSLDEFDENWLIGSQYYKVYEFTAKMYTYDLYELLSEEFTAGKFQNSTDTQ